MQHSSLMHKEEGQPKTSRPDLSVNSALITCNCVCAFTHEQEKPGGTLLFFNFVVVPAHTMRWAPESRASMLSGPAHLLLIHARKQNG